MPIGAIGAMCLRRALQGRWVVGLLSGTGAAIADMALAMAAMFGLSLLTHYILEIIVRCCSWLARSSFLSAPE